MHTYVCMCPVSNQGFYTYTLEAPPPFICVNTYNTLPPLVTTHSTTTPGCQHTLDRHTPLLPHFTSTTKQ